MTENWPNVEEITADPTVSNTSPMSVVNVFFAGKDLQPGYVFPNFVEDVSMLVNDTQVFKLGDVSREVSHIQINYSRNFTSNEGVERRIVLAEFFYDKETGLMVRWDYSYTGLRYGLQSELVSAVTVNQRYDLKETNVWSEPIWLRREVLGGLNVVLLLLVIVLGVSYLRRRMR